jgi:peroxiredoxin
LTANVASARRLLHGGHNPAVPYGRAASGGVLVNYRVTSADIFGGKRVVLFAVPGAFTPACSESHLPGYERHYDEFAKLGVDQVICVFAPLRFPRPWDIEEINKAAFVVRDNNGQTLAYVYFEDEPGRRSAANLLTCAARVATR